MSLRASIIVRPTEFLLARQVDLRRRRRPAPGFLICSQWSGRRIISGNFVPGASAVNAPPQLVDVFDHTACSVGP